MIILIVTLSLERHKMNTKRTCNIAQAKLLIEQRVISDFYFMRCNLQLIKLSLGMPKKKKKKKRRMPNIFI
jgi:hypothetical protein